MKRMILAGVVLCLPLGCSSPCTSSGLPATGQATCYDDKGNVIDRASQEYPGQDGFYRKGFPMAGRFTDNRDGTVTDGGTGLVWQKETAPGTYTWPQALRYSEGLELAGHDDWRLPNVRELQSIVDYGRFDPSIDPVFGAESGWYWSSSTFVLFPGDAWLVSFDVGVVLVLDGKVFRSFVRAVRG